jgi:hypothetical protein
MSTPRRPSGSSSTPGSSREERYESRRGKWLQETSVQIAERELLEEQRGKDLEARRQIEEKNQKLMNPQDLMAENEEYFMNTPKFVLYALRRYCLTKPANHFKNLFMQYDENSDGTLDIQEIKNGIGRLGFDITMKTATEVGWNGAKRAKRASETGETGETGEASEVSETSEASSTKLCWQRRF